MFSSAFARVLCNDWLCRRAPYLHSTGIHILSYCGSQIGLPVSENNTLAKQHGVTVSAPSWQLCASVCITRLPLVAPKPTETEKRYMELVEQEEYERSVLSLWEVEQNRQTEIMNAVESGDRDAQDIDFKSTYQDIEDANEARLREFMDSNERHLDVDMDLRNIHRKMHESLVYIVKQKLGDDEIWLLPGLPVNGNETLRQCAERALSAHKSDEYDATILSNTPSSFYKYKFPKAVRLKSEDDGAKLFIYSAIAKRSVDATAEQRLKERPEDKKSLDFAWATMEEMRDRLKPKYFKAIQKILH